MNFRSNLVFGLGLSLVILIVSSLASYVSITGLIKTSNLVNESNNTIAEIHNVLSLVKDAETGQRGYLLTREDQFLEPYTTAKSQLEQAIDRLELQLTKSPAQKEHFEELALVVGQRIAVLDKNLNTGRSSLSVSSDNLTKGRMQMTKLRRIVDQMIQEEKSSLEAQTKRMNSFASFIPALIILSAIIAVLVTLFFFRKVISSYNQTVSLGDDLGAKNEETQNRLHAIEQVAGRISSGDYNINWDENTTKTLGTLSTPLNKMAESLDTSFKILEEKEWLSSATAQLNERMMGEKSIEALTKEVLDFLTQKTNSQIGAIYLHDDNHYLHRVGGYALDLATSPRKFQVGEGLVGQAFESRREIFLDSGEENPTRISYGTGSDHSTSVMVLPLTRHNIPLGVLELGATHPYSDKVKEFLKSVTSLIGLAFFETRSRIKLQELLEETQAQSEELMTQQTELENINSELEAQSQKLLASEEELRVQQEELLLSNQELEERSQLLEEKNALIEQHNIEIQQKSVELEQSTKYKSEFLANMSHELRTPLNSILLLSKLMSESEEMDAEHQEYSEVIHSSGQGLLTLIDEILDLSKIESGKMILEFSEVAVSDIAQSMKMLFSPQAKEKGLTLNIDTSELEIDTISTDKLRVEQVLRNLLSNAIKFTSQGSVTLKLSGRKEDKNLTFKVEDTGIGIAKEKLALVFEAFQQADGSTQRKYGGTGLGLSISRELARLLGGEITLDSKEGVGSVFTFNLPKDPKETSISTETPVWSVEKRESVTHTPPMLDPATASEPSLPRYISDTIPDAVEDDREQIQPGDKVILIIEDDTSFAKILLDFARKKNFKGLVAVRGDHGIELALHYRPLAILLDIQLPIMDGWQVMEALKANPLTKPIPVHMMSSMKFKHESLLRGAVDFINKPIALEHMESMFDTLEKAMNRSPKKVLIVEENEQHAKALSYYLSSHEITNNIAQNIEQSIEKLNKNEVDCVILDMGVPDQNAYQTLETIKKTEGLEKLPIIVFTGKNLSKGEESKIKKYADSIVVKTAHSYQRILDEAGLFLHLVEEKSKGAQKNKPREQELSLRDILRGKTVLLADDDVRNIFSLTKALEVHGMNIIPVMDGKEALEKLNAHPEIDVVLMDMMMPEMDGYESIRRIRQNPEFRTLPVLAVTSKAMMGDREKCIAAGASDYISKPVDMDQLVSLLRVWLYNQA